MNKLSKTVPGLILIFLLLPYFGNAQTVCTPESRARLEKALAMLPALDPSSSINDLVFDIGKSFMGTPYVEKTLEIPGPEQLVIDLQGVDCTTYLETVVTLARMAKEGKNDFETFEKELELVRYRSGKNEGYPSRLHYFSDWIAINEEKGILTDITEQIGGIPYENKPTFMTENPQFYPQLSNRENVEQLQNIEASIGLRDYFFIPKDQISAHENQIQSGDLIAITTSISNLDMVHVGFAVEQNGRIHLMHASSANQEVEISEKPLNDYLAGNRSQSGIMVARLK
ncbi:N-acetylmuramoyl-L-alanine amidase-like domain-containing protein [uncultured Algoriphagus sp.]|mgnify:CR=1 FL=1|uniref:N-acetylmuramoyl-L-alanine amidase-like domain-containing protein n=1 Tax=uncultured Algoriphagus sp. TaxID=417365 RepID=UPI00258B80E3|nr:N-acetylmuramoyl-L-alanine amidase-like domain-containing protein [uncultured Algoriphagus sp.]